MRPRKGNGTRADDKGDEVHDSSQSLYTGRIRKKRRITDGNFFKRDGKIWWQCRNCGFVIEAEEAPKLCPACKHPQAYFEPKKENY